MDNRKASNKDETEDNKVSPSALTEDLDVVADKPQAQREVGGRGGLDPTRYGDWEKAGRCIDF